MFNIGQSFTTFSHSETWSWIVIHIKSATENDLNIHMTMYNPGFRSLLLREGSCHVADSSLKRRQILAWLSCMPCRSARTSVPTLALADQTDQIHSFMEGHIACVRSPGNINATQDVTNRTVLNGDLLNHIHVYIYIYTYYIYISNILRYNLDSLSSLSYDTYLHCHMTHFCGKGPQNWRNKLGLQSARSTWSRWGWALNLWKYQTEHLTKYL